MIYTYIVLFLLTLTRPFLQLPFGCPYNVEVTTACFAVYIMYKHSYLFGSLYSVDIIPIFLAACMVYMFSSLLYTNNGVWCFVKKLN